MTERTVLLGDPDLPWDGPMPYEYLAARLTEIGAQAIGPDSPASVIRDAFFDLMGGGPPTQEARIVWDMLRRIDDRLVVDFFLYEVPPQDVESALAELGRAEPPVTLPDFRRLADVPPDARLLPEPPDVRVGRAPKLSAVAIDEPPLDLDLADPDWLALLDENDGGER